MRMTRRLCSGAVLVAATWAAPAWATDAAQCASAYEAAQELRAQTKLREARNQLLSCAQAQCPAFIKKDCSKWLAEVDAALPTVVLGARAKGQDLVDVEVKVDGDLLAESLDGKAVPVDPGPHTFTFESAEWGKKEIRYVVKEGKKSQSIEVELAPAETGGGEPGGGDTGASVSTKDASDKTLAYVLLGVGVVGLGGFAYFGLAGNAEKDDLACADTKTCTDEELSPIEQKYLFADISLGVGVVSLGVGTYLLLTSGKGAQKPAPAESAAVRFDVVPSRSGGFARVSGQF